MDRTDASSVAQPTTTDAATSSTAPSVMCVQDAIAHLDPRAVPRDAETFARWWDPDAVVYTNGKRQCAGMAEVVRHYQTFQRSYTAATVEFHFVSAAGDLVTAEFGIAATGTGDTPDAHMYVHASFEMHSGRIREMRQVAAHNPPPKAGGGALHSTRLKGHEDA